jgi:hypothetical protein
MTVAGENTGFPCKIAHPVILKPELECPKCGATLVLRPVPGAIKFPLRLECPEHGWIQEEPRPIRMRFHKDRPDW